MRRVQIFKNAPEHDEFGVLRSVRVPDFTGTFHQFAQETSEDGQANPVAIVESDDGRVHTIYPHWMQFLDRAAIARGTAP